MRKYAPVFAAICAVTLLAIGPAPRFLEELRIGGGYGSQPDGGADLEADGDIFADGSITVKGSVNCSGVSDSSLVAQWPLNEGTGNTATDVSEAEHPGTIITGSGGWTDDSPFRQAYNFSSSRIECGNAADLDSVGPQTVTAWIKPANWGGGNSGMIESKNDTSTLTDALWIHQLNACLRFRRRFSGGAGYGSWRSASNSIALNRWQFVAVTYDHSSSGNDPVFYMNGQAVALVEETAPSGLPMSYPSEPLMIGNAKSLTYGFAGRMADIRIYRRVLSADEIQGLYRAGSENPTFQGLTTVGNVSIGGDATVSGGDADFGASGSTRGVVTAWHGAAGNTPGCLRLGSPNGTSWYLFVEDDGTVRVNSALPTSNGDGQMVGTQF